MKEILVCLEGALSSQRAVDMALDVGRRSGATLVGLAIIDTTGASTGGSVEATEAPFSVAFTQKDSQLKPPIHYPHPPRSLALGAAVLVRDGTNCAVARRARRAVVAVNQFLLWSARHGRARR